MLQSDRLRTLLLVCLLGIGLAATLRAQADRCVLAAPLALSSGTNVIEGDTLGATPDGTVSCATRPGGPDVWYEIVSDDARTVFFDTPSSSPWVVLSLHDGCPGDVRNELACSQAVPLVDQQAAFAADLEAEESYWLRVATYDQDGFPREGGFEVRVGDGARLEGVVSDDTTQPLAGIQVLARRQGGVTQATTTSESGDYSFEELLTGSYTVWAGGGSGFVSEVWDDQACAMLLDCPAGDPIGLGVGDVGLASFELELGAAIEGTVSRDSDGAPIQAILTLYEAGRQLDNVLADASGRYRFAGLEAGTYTVASEILEGYRSELWDNVTCPFFGCDPLTGTGIVVARGETAQGIDFRLDAGAAISGRLTDRTTTQPIPFEDVHAFYPDGSLAAIGRADGGGEFVIGLLDPGDYLVASATRPYVDRLWPDVPCPNDVCDFELGSPIAATLDTVATGIDLALERGAAISGHLANESTLEPIAGVVSVFSGGELVRVALADSLGRYLLEGLAPGSYVFVASDPSGAYRPELHDGTPCAEGCDPSSSPTLDVALGEEVDLNFELRLLPGGCVASATTLCLSDGRFAVEAAWSLQALSELGDASARPLPGFDDSGAFTFFDPGNVEVLVKALDGCGHPELAPRFWLFAAGLTDVRVQMQVTDTWTGDQQVYFNNFGERFAPVLDTAAFATCDAQPPLASGNLPEALREVVKEAVAKLARKPERPSELETAGADCAPTETALCLGAEGRFRVEARWTSASDTGDANAVPFVDDTGLFWFFGPDNVELVVKVLSNCGGASQRFWVFAGGLTDVGVELIVTDTATGATRTYLNELGQQFEPILDTNAFACLP